MLDVILNNPVFRVYAAAVPEFDLQNALSGALGAAIIGGIISVALAIIAWVRGLRPDARAEMELALTQQRETITRLSSSNEQQQTLLDVARKESRLTDQQLDDMQVEITKTSIYIVRLEAYCDDLELKLREAGIIATGRPLRPAQLGVVEITGGVR